MTTTQSSEKSFTWAQLYIRFIIMTLLFVGALFLTAGRIDWWEGWVYVLVVGGFTFYGRSNLLRHNPELIDERVNAYGKEDTKSWDKIIMPLIAVIVPIVMLVVAGFDERFGWTDVYAIPLWAKVVATIVMICGILIANRAMFVNEFYSSTVRIQQDRNHRVVSDGPYRFVRHPSYIGAILANLLTPILLGSWWALIPAVVLTILFVVRTSLEDRTLQTELPGYKDYANKVRYRLIPMIW